MLGVIRIKCVALHIYIHTYIHNIYTCTVGLFDNNDK